VDWRKTVVKECSALGAAKGLSIDWENFADRWRREGYLEAMVLVNAGKLPWMNVDELHRIKLDELLAEHKIALNESEKEHLNAVWHRLEPFPDVLEGLELLRRRYLIASLSNGNVSLLVNMAKNAGIHWDCVLSAEFFRRYKPDPVTYQGSAAYLGARPDEAMLVASHTCDLEGARAAGLCTAFVGRPQQWGIGGHLEPEPKTPFDVYAVDFVHLATKLELTLAPSLART
jgi:2-haloacid dehalogenase